MAVNIDVTLPPKAPRRWTETDVADAFIDSAIACRDEGIDVLSIDPWLPFDLHDITHVDGVTRHFYVGDRRFAFTVVEI